MAKIRDLRKAAGLTQAQAAARIGVSLRTYNRWENDTAPRKGIVDLMQRWASEAKQRRGRRKATAKK